MKTIIKQKLLWFSKEQQAILAESNLNFAIVLFVAALAYAVVALSSAIRFNDRSNLNGVNMWHYTTLVSLWSTSGLIASLSLKLNVRIAELPVRLQIRYKNLAIYYNMAFYFVLTYRYMILADNKVKPLMVFGIIIGVYTIIANISPYILSLVYFSQYFLCVHYIYNSIGRAEAILGFVYVSVFSILATIKARTVKLAFDKSKELELSNSDTVSKYVEQLKINSDMQRSAIIKLADLIEVRDGDTGEHTKRTSDLVRLLAQELLNENIYTDIITPEYIEIISQVSMLHDIGKIKIPDAILNAPRKLTPEEFEIMKLHTVYGKEIISDILFDQKDEKNKERKLIAEEIAYFHHERWDGRGYPKGLYMDFIPLHARIMAIADVYDALISRRCYKEPIPLDETFAIIEDLAGSQFDPLIVNAFIKVKPLIIESSIKD